MLLMNQSPVVRKAKKKCLNGISVPVDINVNKLKGLLTAKVVNGEYAIGNLVVPKTYRKLVLKLKNMNSL